MPSKPDSQSVPPGMLQVARAFRLTGWVSFWLQVVLGVVAALVLLFSTFGRDTRQDPQTVGTGFGIFFAVCGLVSLAISIYWAFRYTRIARQLEIPNASRPSRSSTLQILQLGIIINLVGMLLTILGAEAIVGTLLARSLSQPQGVALYDPSRIIRSLDIFVVQANTNTIAAHFVGLGASFWLLNRVNR